MSKKRQDLESELRKLDSDKHHVDVRIRSIEQSPRNQRILKGDFSGPPPREGDTRKFRRGSERETDDTPSKRSKEDEDRRGKKDEEEGDKSKEKNGENEKEEDQHDGNKAEEEASAPAVSSAVVVNEEPETKDEGAKPERGAGSKRKLGSNVEVSKRDKRIFSSLLMGHLNKAQTRLNKDKDNVSLKKKEELEAKVNQKISQRTVGIREKEAEHLAQQRDQEKKLRDDIVSKAEAKRRELDELIANEHEESLSNFIRTQTEPFVYYLPASHTDKTKKMLAKTREYHELRIKDGLVMLEKDLDQGYIDSLMEHKGDGNSTEATENAKGNKDSDDKEKDQNKDEDQNQKKDSENKKSRDDSPPKKSRKKAKEESSSSSSDSSDSD